jgi:polyribonucleotide nucleotidyltransferase
LAFEELQKIAERNHNLNNGRRVEARSLTVVRTIECSADGLPVVLGSAVFQGGKLQAFVSLTLGYFDGSQEIDAITGGI